MRSYLRSALVYARVQIPSQDIYASIARNSIFLIALTTLSHACIVAQMIMLTRALGPESYGIFAFALTLQSYLFVLSCVGVRPVVVREAIQRPHDLDRVLTAHLVLTASAAGLLALLVVVAAAFAPISFRERVLLGLLAIGNIFASINLLPLFDAHHRQPGSAAMTLTSEATALLLLTYLYHSGRVELGIVGAVFVGKWIANSGMHCLTYCRWMRPIRLTFDAGCLHRMARSSWPLMLAALVAITPFSAGVFFVRLLCDDVAAAIIGLGQQAASAYLLLATAGIRIAQPYLAGPRADDRKFFKHLTVLYVFFVAFLLLSFLCGAFAFVRWMLDFRYQEALIPMLLLLVAAFVQSLGAFIGAYLIVQRDELPVLVAHGCAALFYVLTCWWAVQQAGAVGAAFLSGCAALMATSVFTVRLFERSARALRLPLNAGRVDGPVIPHDLLPEDSLQSERGVDFRCLSDGSRS